jgi:tetratricopeptide (TPR) repeat protein
MSDTNETQPHLKNEGQAAAPAKRPSPWLAILGFILLVGLGALGGYQSGVGQRRAAQSTQVFQQLDEQYQLGLQAVNEGRYEVAFQHFQFVVEHDPAYPGVQDKLTEVLVKLSITPSPTATPTPAFTPTPDRRGVEEIFARARQLMDAGDWEGAIANLDSLRKADPAYRAAEVDGMYFMSLRNRGVGKIVPPSQKCSDMNLEGGIYDLTLAERFGPLDSYAVSLRDTARDYITGASFWELDWRQAMSYFAKVYPRYPALMDASCMSAAERYRLATLKYIETVWSLGNYCAASDMYYDAFLNFPSEKNVDFYPTATQVYYFCIGGDGPQPTPTP